MAYTVTGLSEGQTRALVITERVNSALSIAGIIFVIITFWYSQHFQKPINRLIFFASIGNLGSNVAALISEAGPAAGQNAAICQVQAFLVQMFLGVDCLWAFCMAVNVYLVFFRGYSVKQLRDLDPKYLIFCYGVSFIPAFAFIWAKDATRGRMYGPAIIWCWIATPWDFARLVFLYVWIWVAIALASYVYIRAMFQIYRKRKYLRGFLNPLNENPFANTVTTEIEITREVAPRSNQGDGDVEGGYSPYSVNVNIAGDSKRGLRAPPAVLRMPTITREAANDSVNPEAWLYARVAVLFFIALLITWVPSSVNRVYGLIRPHDINFALNYAASFVFPLQGFWNLIVYLITSKSACAKLWDDIMTGFGGCMNRRQRRQSVPPSSRPKGEGMGFSHRERIPSTSGAASDDDEIKLTEVHSFKG